MPHRLLVRMLLLLGLGFTVGTSPVAPGSAHAAAPTLIEFNVTPGVVDLATDSYVQVSGTLRVDSLGTTPIEFKLLDGWGSYLWTTLTSVTLVDDSTAVFNEPVECCNMSPWTWMINLVTWDQVGDSREYTWEDLAAAGFPDRIEIVSSDQTPPVLLEFSMTPPALDLSQGSDTLRVRAVMSDETVSGLTCTMCWLTFIDPSGQPLFTESVYRLESPDSLGRVMFYRDIGLEGPYESGTWSVRVNVRDSAHNLNEYEPDELAAAGFPSTFQIQSGVSGVGEPGLTPFSLSPSNPNPFHAATQIAFSLSQASDVQLRVFDVSGRLVRTLIAGARAIGRHEVIWDGRDEGGQEVTAGLYYYRLQAGSLHETRSMVRVR